MGVEAERKDEGTSPVWTELVEGGVSAEDAGLGLIGIGKRRHSKKIVS